MYTKSVRRKILVVGAGLCGSVVARELAEKGYFITVIDKRDHIAGNIYDYSNKFGIRVHKYGPHLFHTNNKNVFDWLSKFTEWISYQHKVKAILSNGKYVTLPVNKETKNIVGEENIIDVFFRPYTEKMWGKKLEEISPSVLSRVPVRDDYNELYFPHDEFQYIPKNGYTKMIERILDHENISVKLSYPFNKNMEDDYDHIFNSMPIDEYFDFKFGRLEYRSIKFHMVDIPVPQLFPTSVINLTNNGPFTRLTEWKNIPGHGKNDVWTTITYEEPCSPEENNNEKFYPIKDIHNTNREIYEAYKEINTNKMTFIGRLGMYAYLDMDQAVNIGLMTAKNFK